MVEVYSGDAEQGEILRARQWAALFSCQGQSWMKASPQDLKGSEAPPASESGVRAAPPTSRTSTVASLDCRASWFLNSWNVMPGGQVLCRRGPYHFYSVCHIVGAQHTHWVTEWAGSCAQLKYVPRYYTEILHFSRVTAPLSSTQIL